MLAFVAALALFVYCFNAAASSAQRVSDSFGEQQQTRLLLSLADRLVKEELAATSDKSVNGHVLDVSKISRERLERLRSSAGVAGLSVSVAGVSESVGTISGRCVSRPVLVNGKVSLLEVCI